jgi:large subunit ribosomal protein L22
MAVRAQAKFMLVSPYKVRRYLSLIKDKPVAEAVGILANCNSPTATLVRKLVESASANAENNEEWDVDDLYVARAYADEGPTLPRSRPRARGRAMRIRKRIAHVTVELEQREGEGEEE